MPVIWHKIASEITEIPFGPTGLVEMEVGGKKVCLARHEQRVYACAVKCPHAGGRMSAGFIDPLGNIVCPLHRYKFSLSRGYNVSGEGFYLKTYPVEHRPEGIFMGLEHGGLFSL